MWMRRAKTGISQNGHLARPTTGLTPRGKLSRRVRRKLEKLNAPMRIAGKTIRSPRTKKAAIWKLKLARRSEAYRSQFGTENTLR